jgi:hypothetical protein
VTRPASEVQQVLALKDRGFTVTTIARRLGIPRGTVSYWIHGNVPLCGEEGEGDCATCGGHGSLDDLPVVYAYLLGLYLGDGSIATHARAYKLRVTLDAAYPGIIEEAISAMERIRPMNSVNTCERSGYVEVYSYSKAWPCLFPQHGPGKKHLRPIVLAEWQERLVQSAPHLLLRGLIHSDGCRFMNTGRKWRYPRYSFANLSPNIRRIFTDACDLMDIHWTTSGRNVYVSRMADVDKMDHFIGPKA